VCLTTDNGTRTVKGKVQGGLEYTAVVQVLNVAPAAVFAATPATLSEGANYQLALTEASDPAAADQAAGFTYAFDCGDGSGYGSFGAAASATCPATDAGARTVKGKIRDKDGGEREYVAGVTVDNVAPDLGPVSAPVAPQLVNSAISASAPYTNVAVYDTFTALWSWGDGTTSAGSVLVGSSTVTGTHVYTSPGVYTVSLTLTDDDNSSDQSTYQYVVVYDPNGPFVTGAGAIESPPGAYVPDPDLTGRAHFGFWSKYRPGTNQIDGNAQFRFAAAGFHFRSTRYDWLVVAGARAQFRGEGTVNGSGGYTFLLTAIDGQVNGGGGTDKFRMKVWNTATGAIVYDNQMGMPDDGTPVTTLVEGSIVIHR
jgi:PKD repeat protein